MDRELLKQMARHQAWADTVHWNVLRENPALLDDADIRTRLNHIAQACRMLTTLAHGGTPDPAMMMKEAESTEALEHAMGEANQALVAALDSVDLDKQQPLPRGPKGPWQAPAGMLLLQAITHGQHHRGQNAARMKALGVKPPMTDFIYWYAIGQP
jgi:uncharacterized damage-inducible protein DinB